MIYIRKGREPDSLSEYRKQRYAYYDGYENKDDIRENLLKEQGYLCAYCMRRIHKTDMKIEHWYPESELDDAGCLDYRNMLGVCSGCQGGMARINTTCDTHKGDKKIKVNPQDESMMEHEIKYRRATGEIYSDDPEIQRDLNETLNLNAKAHYLKENRKTALETLIGAMQRERESGTWGRNFLEKVRDSYQQFDAAGKKKEYAGIILWYLNKKLK